MSAYVHGSGMSYRAYLQQKQFVDDIRWDITQSNFNLVATREAVEAQGLRVERAVEAQDANTQAALVAIDDHLEELKYTLHADLRDIERSVGALSAKFDWGIARLETLLGSLNNSLQQLVGIARTPEQTWAYEQFDIARDALRRGLYPEALEHIMSAINGSQQHTGYRLDHRLHRLLAIIRHGDYRNTDEAILDLSKAEEAYLLGARYAEADYKMDAATAVCGAAWVAYCQGQFERAQSHAERSIGIHPTPEAFYTLAKTLVHVGQVESGVNALGSAIHFDPLYALRALADADFTARNGPVHREIDRQRNLKIEEVSREIREVTQNSTPIFSEARELILLAIHAAIPMFVIPRNEQYSDYSDEESAIKTPLLASEDILNQIRTIEQPRSTTPLIDAALLCRSVETIKQHYLSYLDGLRRALDSLIGSAGSHITVDNELAAKYECEASSLTRWSERKERGVKINKAKGYRENSSGVSVLKARLVDLRLRLG